MKAFRTVLFTAAVFTAVFCVCGAGFCDDTDSLVVNESGNVGIGTSVPACRLDVKGSVNVDSDDGYRQNGIPVLRMKNGYNDTFVGYYAGNAETTGYYNTFTGYQSGKSVTSGGYNTFLGSFSGHNDTTGYYNSFMGYSAGYSNTTGYRNAFLGSFAGCYNSSGACNTFLGYTAGYYNTYGYGNTYVGYRSGYRNQSGNYNTLLGRYSGYYNYSGSGNVFLGNYAGYYESGSNKLFIENTPTSLPLVYGEFDHDILTVHGNLGIHTKTEFGGGTGGVIGLHNASTVPTSNPLNGVVIYAQDGELRVRNSSGTVTQLSSHNDELFEFDADDEVPWSFTHEITALGKRASVNMSKLARLVEELTGEKLTYVEDIPRTDILTRQKENWKNAWIASHVRKVQIAKEEAFETVRIEEPDTDKITGERVRYELEGENVKEISVPVYAQKTVEKRRLKPNVRFCEETGKFFLKVVPTSDEAEAASKNHFKPEIPTWLNKRIQTAEKRKMGMSQKK